MNLFDLFQVFENIPEHEGFIQCAVGGSKPITFLIDSGAEVDVVSKEDWEQLKRSYENDSAALYDIEAGSKKRILACASNDPLHTGNFLRMGGSRERRKAKMFREVFHHCGRKEAPTKPKDDGSHEGSAAGINNQQHNSSGARRKGHSVSFPVNPR